jgi:hypothetical protein
MINHGFHEIWQLARRVMSFMPPSLECPSPPDHPDQMQMQGKAMRGARRRIQVGGSAAATVSDGFAQQS